jgi:hypothetical protein
VKLSGGFRGEIASAATRAGYERLGSEKWEAAGKQNVRFIWIKEVVPLYTGRGRITTGMDTVRVAGNQGGGKLNPRSGPKRG